jgi:hypothetical protein
MTSPSPTISVRLPTRMMATAFVSATIPSTAMPAAGDGGGGGVGAGAGDGAGVPPGPPGSGGGGSGIPPGPPGSGGGGSGGGGVPGDGGGDEGDGADGLAAALTRGMNGSARPVGPPGTAGPGVAAGGTGSGAGVTADGAGAGAGAGRLARRGIRAPASMYPTTAISPIAIAHPAIGFFRRNSLSAAIYRASPRNTYVSTSRSTLRSGTALGATVRRLTTISRGKSWSTLISRSTSA